MTTINILPLAAVCAIFSLFGSSCDKINRNREAFSASAGKVNHNKVSTTKAGKFSGAEIPVTPGNIPSQIKHYEGYTLSFNSSTGNPNWSAWELLPSETDGTVTRSGKKFWQDDEIVGCVTSKDYSNTGYDRGHLCPAADMKWSEQAMNDCFSMANITPQSHALNSGAWSTLEKKSRLWAQRDGGLLIAAGPIYEGATSTIAGGRVKVPTAFFKVIVAPYLERPRGIAFVYPNDAAPGNMNLYTMSIDDVEQLTGYDFFAPLPDDIENQVESAFSFKEWDKR